MMKMEMKMKLNVFQDNSNRVVLKTSVVAQLPLFILTYAATCLTKLRFPRGPSRKYAVCYLKTTPSAAECPFWKVLFYFTKCKMKLKRNVSVLFSR